MALTLFAYAMLCFPADSQYLSAGVRMFPLMKNAWMVDAYLAVYALPMLEALNSELCEAITVAREQALLAFADDLSRAASPAIAPAAPAEPTRVAMAAAVMHVIDVSAPTAGVVPLIQAPVPVHPAPMHADPRVEFRSTAAAASAAARADAPRESRKRVPTPHPEVVIDLGCSSSSESSSGEDSPSSAEGEDQAWAEALLEDLDCPSSPQAPYAPL